MAKRDREADACMYLISSAGLAGSASVLRGRGYELSGFARLTRTVVGCCDGTGQLCLFGRMCEVSPPRALLPTPTVGDSRNSRNATANRSTTGHHSGVTLSDWILMSSAGASPVRTFQSQAKGSGLPGSAAAYGRSTPELLARYDPDTSSSKTSQTCEADQPWSSGGLTVAYVAGLIDGEGCLYIVRRKRWFYPRLDLAMADKALPLLQKLHHQFGGSLNLHRKATERWDSAHRWALMGKPLRELLTSCLPFLQLKKRQAELCLNSSPADAETQRALLTELNRKGPGVTPEAGWFARRAGGRWLTPQQN